MYGKGLFTPWTMKFSQGLVNFGIGCCICLATTSVYTKEKCQGDHEVQGLQKICVKAYIIHRCGSMGFVVGEPKEVLQQKIVRAHDTTMLLYTNFNEFYFGKEKMKTREDKRMVKL